MRISLRINGEEHEADCWEGESLLFALREKLGFPGSKNACEQGECGSCSVLLDGTLVCACLVLAAQADGHDVTTVEGLADGDELHRGAAGVRRGGRGAVRLLHAGPRRRDGRSARSARRARPTTRSARRSPATSAAAPATRRSSTRCGWRRAAHDADRAPRTLQVGKIGELVPRADAPPKVKGEFAYASDLIVPGMLWGHTLRSPHAHARIVSIDISEALTMPGVHAVLTHADVPGQKHYGLEFPDQPVLAIDRVLYYGEPVALVAAEHPEQARRAAEKIRVEYEPLEPVDRHGARDRAADLHPERPTRGHGYRDDPRPNVVRHMVIRHGDPDAEGDVVGRAASTRSASRTRRSSGRSPGSPCRTARAASTSTSRRSGCTSTARRSRRASDSPLEQVRIHLAGVGGAFGGREDLSMQIHGALLALHTNRPVKIVYNREESFTGHVHRHPARIWCEHRATRDGRLVNVRMRILLDGGAYASSLDRGHVERGVVRVGPYEVAERAASSRRRSTRTTRRAARCAASARCRRASRRRRRWTSSPPRSRSTRSSCGC